MNIPEGATLSAGRAQGRPFRSMRRAVSSSGELGSPLHNSIRLLAEEGQTLVEYGLILALVALHSVAVLIVLGGHLGAPLIPGLGAR